MALSQMSLTVMEHRTVQIGCYLSLMFLLSSIKSARESSFLSTQKNILVKLAIMTNISLGNGPYFD